MARFLNLKARTVSDALAENPRALDGGKLSLVGKCIALVDDLRSTRFDASQALLVTTLYLSNNSIDEIQHIAQFRALRTLSLGNNLIRFTQNLKPLKELVHLENLALEGNPVCSMVYYREKVIFMCPTLVMLDACPVAQEERETAAAAVRKINALEQQLDSNACRILVLEHLCNMLACHAELFQTVLAQFRVHRHPTIASSASVQQQSPAQVLKVASRSNVYSRINDDGEAALSGNLSLVERQTQNALFRMFAKHMRSMRPEVRVKALQTHTQRRSLWDKVISECLQQQQYRIAELLEACELNREPMFSTLDAATEQVAKFQDAEWAMPEASAERRNLQRPAEPPKKAAAIAHELDTRPASAARNSLPSRQQASKRPPQSVSISEGSSASASGVEMTTPSTAEVIRLQAGTSLSGSLPPQQEEPVDFTPELERRPTTRLTTHTQLAPPAPKADVVSQIQRFIVAATERSNTPLPDLQFLALHHSVTQADLCVAVYKLPVHRRPALNASMREVQVHLGIIYDEIDRFIPYISGLLAAQSRIRKTAEKLRKKASSNIRSSLAHLETIGHLIKATHDDINQGRQWVTRTRNLSDTFHKWQVLEESRQAALMQLLADIQAAQQAHEVELERRERLQQCQLEGDDAIVQAGQQFKSADFVAAMKHREMLAKAKQYRQTRMHSTKRHLLLRFQAQVRWQQQLKAFRDKVKARQSHDLMRITLNHWMKYHDRQQAALMVKRLENLRRVSLAWFGWQQAHWRAQAWQQAAARMWEGKLHRYFDHWAAAWTQREDRRRAPSGAAAETFAAEGNANPDRNEALQSRADHYFFRSRFRAWQAVYKESIVRFAKLQRIVESSMKAMRLTRSLQGWHAVVVVRQHERHRKLRQAIQMIHSHSSTCHFQLMSIVRATNATVERKMQSAVHTWREHTHRTRRSQKRTGNWLRNRRARVLRDGFAVWYRVHCAKYARTESNVRAMAHYLKRLLTVAMKFWRNGLSKLEAYTRGIDALDAVLKRNAMQGAWTSWISQVQQSWAQELTEAAARKYLLEQQLARQKVFLLNSMHSWKQYVHRRRCQRRCFQAVHVKVNRQRQRNFFRGFVEAFIKQMWENGGKQDLRVLEQQLVQLRERSATQVHAMQDTSARVNAIKEAINDRKRAIARIDQQLLEVAPRDTSLQQSIVQLRSQLAKSAAQRETVATEINAVSSLLLSTEALVDQSDPRTSIDDSHVTLEEIRAERAHLLQDLEWLHIRLVSAESQTQHMSEGHADQLVDAIKVSKQYYGALESSQSRIEAATEERTMLAQELQRCHELLQQTVEQHHDSWEYKQRQEELQGFDTEKQMLKDTIRVLELEEQSLLEQLEAARKQATEAAQGQGQNSEVGTMLASIGATASSAAQAAAANEALRRWEFESNQRDIQAMQHGRAQPNEWVHGVRDASKISPSDTSLRQVLQRAMQMTAQAIHTVHVENSVQIASAEALPSGPRQASVAQASEKLVTQRSGTAQPTEARDDTKDEEIVKHRIIQRLRSGTPSLISA